MCYTGTFFTFLTTAFWGDGLRMINLPRDTKLPWQNDDSDLSLWDPILKLVFMEWQVLNKASRQTWINSWICVVKNQSMVVGRSGNNYCSIKGLYSSRKVPSPSFCLLRKNPSSYRGHSFLKATGTSYTIQGLNSQWVFHNISDLSEKLGKFLTLFRKVCFVSS